MKKIKPGKTKSNMPMGDQKKPDPILKKKKGNK